MRRTVTLALVVVAPLLAVACKGTTIVDVKAYDQSCKVDGDCVVVQSGDICCGCPNAAINKGDLPRYQDDLGTCEAVCAIGCVGDVVAVCVDGTCGTQTK